MIGDTLVENNQVKAITVGSTTANEAYGVYVVAAVPGDLSDNNCLATYPTFAVAGCSTEAVASSPVAGTSYCGRGDGTTTVTGGLPNQNNWQHWGPSCPTYPPPSQAVVSTLLFLGCQDLCARWQLSYSALHASTFRIESKPQSGGTWTTYTVTASSPTILHLGQNARQ